MNREGRSVSFESAAWGLVLVLAASLRWYGLSAAPIGPDEAPEALAAASGTNQASVFYDPGVESQPTSALYDVATRVIFLFGGADEGAARAVPAVAGLLPLVVLWSLRKRMGTIPSLFLGVWVAVSPMWVATSRTAGGTALALGAAAAAVYVASTKSPRSGGIAKGLLATSLGFGLASGPSFLTGLLGLSLAWWASRVIWRNDAVSLPGEWTGRDLAEVGLGSVAIAIAVSSGLGMALSGVEILFSGVRAWLTAWIQPAGLPLGTSILLLAAYEPLIVVLGLLGALRAVRHPDSVGRLLLTWSLVAAGVFFLSVGRRPEDAIWALLPLSFLAARMVQDEVESADRTGYPVAAAGLWVALIVLAAFIAQQFSAYLSGIGPGADASMPQLRLPIALGGLGIGVVVVVLVGFGWDWATTKASAFGAVAVALLALTISASWRLNLSGDRDRTAELWRPHQGATGLVRLRHTLESLALSQTGTPTIPVSLAGSRATPSLAWALRSFPAYVPEEVGPGRAPPIVLQPEGVPLPRLPAQYLGQAITLEHAWGWQGPWPPDVTRWWFRGTAPLAAERWVLYVREDVATLSPAEPEAAP